MPISKIYDQILQADIYVAINCTSEEPFSFMKKKDKTLTKESYDDMYSYCNAFFYPLGVHSYIIVFKADGMDIATVAHEAFHCIYALMSDSGVKLSMPVKRYGLII